MMAKSDMKIEVSLDPDVMELLRNLVLRIEALERGADWRFMVKCHDCPATSLHDTLFVANSYAEAHSAVVLVKGSRAFHAPYVQPVVRR